MSWLGRMMAVVLPSHRTLTRVSTHRYGRHWDVNKVLLTQMPFRWVADPEPDSLTTVWRRYAAQRRATLKNWCGSVVADCRWRRHRWSRNLAD
jgi:hypothetical protein